MTSRLTGPASRRSERGCWPLSSFRRGDPEFHPWVNFRNFVPENVPLNSPLNFAEKMCKNPDYLLATV
jgi:hypothetical protein